MFSSKEYAIFLSVDSHHLWDNCNPYFHFTATFHFYSRIFILPLMWWYSWLSGSQTSLQRIL